MLEKVIRLKEFYVITFPSTQSALQAEKVLYEGEKEFVLIPLPREISASCGLAVKCSYSEKDRIIQLLKEHKVKYSKIYNLKK